MDWGQAKPERICKEFDRFPETMFLRLGVGLASKTCFKEQLEHGFLGGVGWTNLYLYYRRQRSNISSRGRGVAVAVQPWTWPWRGRATSLCTG